MSLIQRCTCRAIYGVTCIRQWSQKASRKRLEIVIAAFHTRDHGDVRFDTQSTTALREIAVQS